MTVQVVLNYSIVEAGEFRFSYQLAPDVGQNVERSLEEKVATPRVDKVLPLSSSTLSPGLSVPVSY